DPAPSRRPAPGGAGAHPRAGVRAVPRAGDGGVVASSPGAGRRPGRL
ncbi:MAG: hypothetical protein AVDCRST_MAG32-1565, partial [uncultured Nocardioides sp.]